MIESDILKALQTAALAAAAASTYAALPVKTVGRSFTPPDDGKWLELVYIPNNISGEFWSSGKTYRGLFRLLLHWPMNEMGVYDGLKVIESVADYFAKGSDFVSNGANVRIYDHPDLTDTLEQPPEILFPVSVRYQCFKA